MTVHYFPNPMFNVAVCSVDTVGKGTYDWKEVTCKKCLEVKDES